MITQAGRREVRIGGGGKTGGRKRWESHRKGGRVAVMYVGK